MTRLLGELVANTALVLAAVLLVLLAGQLAQIGDLLWSAGAAAPWAAVLGRGALILLEAALPLAGLVGAGLVYGRLRSEGAWVAHAALGGHPLGALWPAVAVGGALAVAAAGLAHRVVPDAVAGLRGELVAAAEAALQVPDRALALPGGGVARREPGGAWWAVLPSGLGAAAGEPRVRACVAGDGWAGAGEVIHAASGSGRGDAPVAEDESERAGGTGVLSRGEAARAEGGSDRVGGAGESAMGGRCGAAEPADAAPPLLVRAGAARIEDGVLALDDARLWSPTLRVAVGEARVALGDDALGRRLAMFGPPNATPTAALDRGDLHHRFTAARRTALPAMAPLWALLGALLGARLGGAVAVAGGAAAVGAGYWLLRTGELSARAGLMSPWLAAWAPALVLGLALGWALYRDPSLARPG